MSDGPRVTTDRGRVLLAKLMAELRASRREVDRLREKAAIVGLGCRFPGGEDPRGFWARLAAGDCTVTQGRPDGPIEGLPEESPPWGGHLAGMDRFDAPFFRIAPVEAEFMDPQQRLVLETSWEALEDAGMDPEGLSEQRVGVYVGLSAGDYHKVARDAAPNLYMATGNSFGAAIGRVAFTLGLRGPAIAVDTACSASLVAIHQAVGGLQRGDADLALAGGVNAVLLADLTRLMEARGILAPDGRCKTFDARADGYVRGEGCGILVLKRLSEAERDGDRILGVILGSAVNQDGASAGLTVPNGPAQEDVIREALARAGVPPSEVDYLEAHGTGTELGDPIEVQAAAAVYGEGRDSGNPLLMGSVKSSIGHVEAAAGVAGVIKVLLSMRHGVIPKQVHFERPNPRIPWEDLSVRVVSEATAWPETPERRMRAGVSSFGFSGTNAHLILESYGEAGEAAGPAVSVPLGPPASDRYRPPEAGETQFAERRQRVLPLSGRSGAALSALAGRYLEWLEEDGDWERLSDGAWTAGVGRSHFGVRAGMVFSDGEELREELGALASGGVVPGAQEGLPGGEAGKVAFLFTGQGSQWVGMGRDLYEREPVFREVLDRAEGVIREERGESLLSVLFGGAADLDGASWAQPAVFALQGGLVALWRSVGVEPAAVLGHSLGEVGAACAAGVFGFEEGLLFASRRGALLGSLPRSGRGSGGMLAVFAPLPEVMSAISEVNAGARGQLDLAAENGMHQVVSGPRGLLGKLSRRFEGLGVRVEPLSVSPAGHSLLVEPVLGGLEEAASELRFGAPVIPLVTGVTGRPAGAGEVEDGAYWRRQARTTVRFAAGVESLASLGSRVLIELGPRGVLGPMAALSWPAGEGPSGGPVVVSSQGGSEVAGDRAFAAAVSVAYGAGLPVAFEGLYGGERRRRISAPAYPFQRKRYWVQTQVQAPAETAPAETAPAAPEASGDPTGDPEIAARNLAVRLRETPFSERLALLRDLLGKQVQTVLRLSAPPPHEVGFFELGMDSMMAVEVRNRVNRALGGETAAATTAAFDHPNVSRLAEHLARWFGDPAPAGAEPAPPFEERSGPERIAVVGMACRFPGGPDAASFWSRLAAGSDEVSRGRPDDLMPDREPRDPGPWGAYVAHLDRFDAAFFRIAPVEAEMMDPQQRLLLETSWEAIEDAGLDPVALRGSRTAVYAGVATRDYEHLLSLNQRDPARSLYFVTGNASAAAIGRVAFSLGLQGPAIAVDTACSSSLVAIHQAVAALSRREADLALSGGVNAILIAAGTGLLDAGGMLAPDGRCKTFDAAADGYVRGEGCGVLVLKRLADAERDGDRILGVILGSAVNQDGASAGFTVPNGPAQEAVIREALARAAIEPDSVDYLEAHGTGTALGDPIEVQAAAAVYGAGRAADRPLLLGSVKTNIGHLEAGAGVAGAIKVLLSMRRGLIPAHLHFERPNPRLDWDRLPVRVTSEATAWPEVTDRPARAAVSSFGVSGTNAHLVLEGYGAPGEAAGAAVAVPVPGVEPPAPAPEARRYRLLPLSGRSERVLSALAGRYLAWLDESPEEVSWDSISDAAWTAGVGRRHFGQRAGVLFECSPGEDGAAGLRSQLATLAAAPERPAFREGPVSESAPGRVGFLFTGQASQWAGMGRDLYEREPVARAVLDSAERVIRDERGASLLEVMFKRSEAPGDLDATEWTQPAIYALQGALLALWRSVGIEADAVLGHSVGEIAAAHAAGVFGFEEGLRFASRRGALMGSLPATGRGSGRMLAVFASEATVGRAIRDMSAGTRGTVLELAAANGAHQVVSGSPTLVSRLGRRLREREIRTEPLPASHAFHSGLMESVLDDLEDAAAALPGSPASVPLVTGLTGRVAAPGELGDPAYWRRQARAPVRFADGVRALAGLGCQVLVELGPQGVLGPMAAFCWPEPAGPAARPVFVASQAGARTRGDRAFLAAVARAYEAGLPVSLGGLYAGERRRRVSVPHYPFARERYWLRERDGAPASPSQPPPGARTSSLAEVEALLYEVEWKEPEGTEREAPAAARPDRPDRGRWVFCAGPESAGVARELAAELEARGQKVLVLREDGAAASRDSWQEVFRGLPADLPLLGVVYLAEFREREDLSAAELETDVEDESAGALALVQGLHDAGRTGLGLWFVTRGAQVIEGSAAGGLSGATLWGLAKVAAWEQNGLSVRLVDLDPGTPPPVGTLSRELLDPDRETQVAYRAGRRLVARIQRYVPPAASDSGPAEEPPAPAPLRDGRLRPDRTYLVTGGLGGLGLTVARWLADRGAGAILLNGRRPPDAAAGEAVRELRDTGAEVRVELGDVTEEETVARLIGCTGGEGGTLPPLGGVIHSAGVFDDVVLSQHDPARMERVLRPKVIGAWRLHRATLELDLDLFVLFSSTAAVIGHRGVAAYAAANAFLDQLAEHRRRLGLAGQAVAWGAWSKVGSVEGERGRLERYLERIGFGWVTPEQGIAALELLLRDPPARAMVARVDWSLLAGAAGIGSPLWEHLASASAIPASRNPASQALLGEIRGASRPEREAALVRFLRQEVQSVLGLESRPSPETGFFDLGLDSLMALELRDRVNGALAGEVVAPETIVFDHPNITLMAERLADLLDPFAAPRPVAHPPVFPRPREQRIAVVGMACRFPGGAGLAGFRELLADGGDAVTSDRPDGLVVDDSDAAGADGLFGAYLPGLDRFDAGFFRIAPVEAELMDPQQRLLLEVSWEALEDAGIAPAALRGTRTGVYVGVTTGDYRQILQSHRPSGRDAMYMATGTSFAAAIGRVAFTLGLEGPAIAVDTACSSSLVAIHQAAAALERGEADLALAGGVNAILLPEVTRLMKLGGTLAPDGRCKAFDGRADGYVRGEGCGILVLRRLSEAERDGTGSSG